MKLKHIHIKRKQIVPLAAAFILAACTSAAPLPRLAQAWPQQDEVRWFKLVQTAEDGRILQTSLLAVQPDGSDGLRFVQTDALGAPLARQTVSRKGWANDGFVAPNRRAQQVFAAVVPLIDPQAAVYPQPHVEKQGAADIYFQNGKEMWRIVRQNDAAVMMFPDRSVWQLTPLDNGQTEP
ncbi:hypothetical protein LVJ83_06475 [Uruburuella testudinis]|uniref:Lipoprotein n=1 Tax=Uruburuella testudinis TaxID=1282863 RepID=A0ABY4DWM7_9NEIS|nr:hypothetical protein [Uruburuella testudinis]UOO83099.1 hypothetical protein LVJ83_06475 [Uruburuella testudinis]